eukprot:445740-Lingulodinium_polyedra.AAC.1
MPCHVCHAMPFRPTSILITPLLFPVDALIALFSSRGPRWSSRHHHMDTAVPGHLPWHGPHLYWGRQT